MSIVITYRGVSTFAAPGSPQHTLFQTPAWMCNWASVQRIQGGSKEGAIPTRMRKNEMGCDLNSSTKERAKACRSVHMDDAGRTLTSTSRTLWSLEKSPEVASAALLCKLIKQCADFRLQAAHTWGCAWLTYAADLRFTLQYRSTASARVSSCSCQTVLTPSHGEVLPVSTHNRYGRFSLVS